MCRRCDVIVAMACDVGDAVIAVMMGAETAVLGGAAGLFVARWSVSPPSGECSIVNKDTVTALAARWVDGAVDQVAVGNSDKLSFLDATTLSVLRWEWVTQVSNAATCRCNVCSTVLSPPVFLMQLSTTSGAPIDGAITGLDYDSCGSLWVATPVCVNVVAVNGSIYRIAGLQGLPMNNLTSVVADGGIAGDVPRAAALLLVITYVFLLCTGSVWLGSTLGAMRFSPRLGPACFESVGSQWGSFRYYAGMRYLPSDSVRSVASAGNRTVILTSAGITLVEHQEWTLAAKANHYAVDVLPRIDQRYGFVADCSLPSPGDVSSPTCSVGESDGLWTSIQLAAEALRYATEPSDALLATIQRRLAAMEVPLTAVTIAVAVTVPAAAAAAAAAAAVIADATTAVAAVTAVQLLYNTTGIAGYPARTTGRLGDPGVPSSPTGWWHPSTTVAGWMWLGNTSSDEIVGHFFSLPLAYNHVGGNASGAADTIRYPVFA